MADQVPPVSEIDQLREQLRTQERTIEELTRGLRSAIETSNVALAVVLDGRLTLILTNGVMYQRAGEFPAKWAELEPVPNTRAAIARAALEQNAGMAVVAG